MQSRDAGLPTSPGQVALPGVPQGECGTRGRRAVPLHLAQLVYERKVSDMAQRILFKRNGSMDDLAGGLTLHHNAQNVVNARLVAPALTLEPIEHVRIETNRQLLLGRGPSRRCFLEKGL